MGGAQQIQRVERTEAKVKIREPSPPQPDVHE
jgi:hypothetical protein